MFRDAYGGGRPTSYFRNAIRRDRRYFPYLFSAKSTVDVFAAEPSPVKALPFMPSEDLRRLVVFHDAATLLNNALDQLHEDRFRDLNARRKMAVFGEIVDLYATVHNSYAPCRDALSLTEARFTDRSLRWKLLFPIRSRSIPYLAVTAIWLCTLAVAATTIEALVSKDDGRVRLHDHAPVRRP